jgi:hypothetical protein
MPHWSRVHRRIPQGVLPREKCRLRVLRKLTNLRTHSKSMYPIHKSPGKPAGRKQIALPELLGTPKGIAALTEFLKHSGAFIFTGERHMPKNAPTFETEPELPDIDSEDDASDSDQ